MALKLLYITTFARSRFGSFAKSSIAAARELGIEYHIASNETGIDLSVKDAECKELGIYHHHIDINRSPAAVRDNRLAKKQISELIEKYRFDAIHCNTPIGGVLGRLCGKKYGIKTVIYQAHGFHFWTGAPKKNWLIYYPVEKYLARYTDILITINKEDYKRAENFHLKKGGKIYYVHGVGVDCKRFLNSGENKRSEIRNSLGLKADDILLLSVGELNENKNHAEVIRAISKCDNTDLHYAVAGKGDIKASLELLAKELNLEQRVHFLGFIDNMPDHYKAADLFVFPSKREGLPSAVMEAMASGLPCLVSNIRGCNDLIDENGGLLFDPSNDRDLSEKIEIMLSKKDSWAELGEYNKEKVLSFGFDNAVAELTEIYKNICCNEEEK